MLGRPTRIFLCIALSCLALPPAQTLRQISERIPTLPAEERASFVDGALGPVHYKAVDHLYADSGPVMVDLLKRNPLIAIPVILLRMEQKDAEW